MNDIMLDLETLGTNSNAPIVSIGAVWFDLERLGTSFYVVLDLEEQVNYLRRKIDPKTIQWWMTQSEEARKVFAVETEDVYEGLEKFEQFVGTSNPNIWGNGSDFDNILLGNLYDSLGYKKPWSYSKNRCYRTLKNLGIMTREPFPEFEGTQHDALADAKHQARCAQIYLKGAMPSAKGD